MEGKFPYSAEEIRTAGEQMLFSHENFGEELAQLTSMVSRLTGSVITKAMDSGAYEEQFRELNESLIYVSKKLDPLGNYLKSYGQQLEEMDKDWRR